MENRKFDLSGLEMCRKGVVDRLAKDPDHGAPTQEEINQNRNTLLIFKEIMGYSRLHAG